MQPTIPQRANRIYRAPPGTEDKCLDIHVRVQDDQVFGSGLTSVWEPTPEELAALNAGGKIAVTLFVPIQPVMIVGVEG